MSGLRIDVLTILPGWFEGPLRESLLGRAIADRLVDVRVHDLRDWATDRHRTVDDAPYGGGAGMVMRADVVVAAAEAVWNDRTVGEPAPADARFVAGGPRPETLLLTPRGRRFRQADARRLAALDRVVLVCGRYEGIDERAHELVATDEISIGDYVLFGGEVAAMAVIESVVRLVDGAVGNVASPEDESFAAGLLEYPQFTRPRAVRGLEVPEVLTSGDHGAVAAWRRRQAIELTRDRRPDLLDEGEDPPPVGPDRRQDSGSGGSAG